jgi:hypothetical protein
MIALASGFIATLRHVLLCKIDAYRPALECGVVQVPVSALCVIFAVELAESKALGSACFSVHNEPATQQQTAAALGSLDSKHARPLHAHNLRHNVSISMMSISDRFCAVLDNVAGLVSPAAAVGNAAPHLKFLICPISDNLEYTSSSVVSKGMLPTAERQKGYKRGNCGNTDQGRHVC